jgi:uncharacterized surface protein with fasciclin (FAS1) repeats
MNIRKVTAVVMTVAAIGGTQFVSRAGAATMAPSDKTSDPMVGGAAMYPRKNIIQNAIHSKDHTTLVAAVKAAGLVSTLSGPGPFTVFAPTNEAFAALPEGTVTTLLKPENKATLTKILTYHVVAGDMDSMMLAAAIHKGGGKAVLTTVAGAKLTVSFGAPGTILVTDVKGDVAKVTIADVYQSNGVIHVVDHVLLPQ